MKIELIRRRIQQATISTVLAASLLYGAQNSYAVVNILGFEVPEASDFFDILTDIGTIFDDIGDIAGDVSDVVGDVGNVLTDPINTLRPTAEAVFGPLIDEVEAATGVDLPALLTAATDNDLTALLNEALNVAFSTVADINTIGQQGTAIIDGVSGNLVSQIPGVECEGDLQTIADAMAVTGFAVDAAGQVVEAASALGGVFTGFGETGGIVGQIISLGLEAGDVIVARAGGAIPKCSETFRGSVTIDPLDPLSDLRPDDPGNLTVSSGDLDVTLGDIAAGGDVNAGGDINADGSLSADSNVTADVDVSAGGDVSAGDDVIATDDVTAGGDVIATDDVTAGGDVIANGNVSTSGNVTASGNISATAMYQPLVIQLLATISRR